MGTLVKMARIPAGHLVAFCRTVSYFFSDQYDLNITAEQVMEALTKRFGSKITYVMLGRLDPNDFVTRLSQMIGKEVFGDAAQLVQGMVAAWESEIRICSNASCGRAGLRLKDDGNGFYLISGDELCTFCEVGYMKLEVAETTHVHWVTGQRVALTLTCDTSLRGYEGASIPLTDEEVMRHGPYEKFVSLLKAEGVSLVRFLGYLCRGNDHQVPVKGNPMMCLRVLTNPSAGGLTTPGYAEGLVRKAKAWQGWEEKEGGNREGDNITHTNQTLTLTGQDRVELTNALCSAFWTRGRMDELLFFELGTSADDVGGSNLREIALNTIRYAESGVEGGIKKLIEGARRQNSGNRDLMVFAAKFDL